MSLFIPTRFLWRFGGSKVHLCGSFTRWVETVPMTPVEGQPNAFSVIVHLPPGYHQYKFIVDGEWRHDETQPFMPDPLGNVNNWLFVRKPEGHQQEGTPASRTTPAPSSQAQDTFSLHPAMSDTMVSSSSQQQQHLTPSAAALPPSMDIAPPSTAAPAETSPGQALVPPQLMALDPNEPGHSKKKIKDFLATHTAYELVPESGKIVILDVDLPIRHAFHALHDQGMVSAPLWDSEKGRLCGMVSASDFILSLQRLRSVVMSGGNTTPEGEAPQPLIPMGDGTPQQTTPHMELRGGRTTTTTERNPSPTHHHHHPDQGAMTPLSEREMDLFTVRTLREELAHEGTPPKKLVYAVPTDSLCHILRVLIEHRCATLPILSQHPYASMGKQDMSTNAAGVSESVSMDVAQEEAPATEGVPQSLHTTTSSPSTSSSLEALHVASISSIVACLMRHFGSNPPSLPLLSQPLESLNLGTWSPESQHARRQSPSSLDNDDDDAMETYGSKSIKPLTVVTHQTQLTEALQLLLETGLSSLPVVERESGVPLDVWSRADITLLARSSAYHRLQFEDVTVGQALSLASMPATHGVMGGGMAQAGGRGGGASSSASSAQDMAVQAGNNSNPPQRLFTMTAEESFKVLLEKLALPGVRRVVMVHPDSKKAEGIISLSDVGVFLLGQCCGSSDVLQSPPREMMVSGRAEKVQRTAL